MKELQAVIKNSAGIHCRPSAVITQEFAEVDSEVTVITSTRSCQLGSALDLLMLCLEYGTKITIRAEGPDEEVAVVKFKELFEREFDFPNAGQGTLG